MTDSAPVTRFTPALLREVLQQGGYRVELSPDGPGGAPVLRSATAGMAFEVHFANPVRGDSAAFSDLTCQAVFQVQGELPLSLVNQWNAGRRFGRLHLVRDLLLLHMDVLAIGGVTREHLRAQMEIWDHLLQQLVAFLREELPKLAKAAPVAEPAPDKGQSAAPLN